jgi:hypothetical protein
MFTPIEKKGWLDLNFSVKILGIGKMHLHILFVAREFCSEEFLDNKRSGC